VIRVTLSPAGRRVSAPGYNAIFVKETGLLARWGATEEEDPLRAPSPELFDIEIGTDCDGPSGIPCRHCYKSNVRQGEQMPLERFQAILDRIPPTVNQIAFGVGNLGDYVWPIFEATRARHIVPNVTISGSRLTPEVASRLAKTCGAVAVSRYGDGNRCYDSVAMLVEAGVHQVTIHQVVAEQTMEACHKALRDAETDPRLTGLHAITFLMLKPRGRGISMTPMTDLTRYRDLVQAGLAQGTVGFDSCSAGSVKAALVGEPQGARISEDVEACESGLFSLYIDVKGHAYPCSFTPKTPGWEAGIDVLASDNFLRDVWHHPRLLAWVDRLQGNCRRCPLYDIECREKNQSGISGPTEASSQSPVGKH
jgi:radical SAM protein with 4Fe4S-binding SPASM domain